MVKTNEKHIHKKPIDKITDAVIFAAGMGSRFSELTRFIPKPIIKILGTEIVGYMIEMLVNNGVKNFYINSHYKAEQINNYIASLRKKYKNIQFEVFFEEELLDTGGTLQAISKEIQNDDFFVCNCDSIFINHDFLANMVADYYKSELMALLCVTNKKIIGNAGDGDFICGENKIEFKRGKDLTNISNSDIYTYTGFQIMNKKIIKKFNAPFSLVKFWGDYLKNGKINYFIYNDAWCHIGDLDSYYDTLKYIETNHANT